MTVYQSTTPQIMILRRHDVEQRTGLSRSKLYEMINPSHRRYDASFPKQIKLGENSVGWVASELSHWLESKMHARDQAMNAADELRN
jgi:prophage regulatory protein